MQTPEGAIREDDEPLTCADAARVVTGIGPDITSNGIRVAADEGRIRVARRTRGGIRLFRLADVVEFAHERRSAARHAAAQSLLSSAESSSDSQEADNQNPEGEWTESTPSLTTKA